ncbi:MAG: response regulator [Deltaproteobacteria bacterium]|nr:response regulator [Deltaproteobacteria bacterium]
MTDPTASAERRATILIVEDERVVAKDLANTLTGLGYDVVGSVKSGREAIDAAQAQRPDLILMDISLPGEIDGITAAAEIKRVLDRPIVYLTAYSDGEILVRARQTEPHGYLVKPFRGAELRSTIEMALYKHAMERRLREREQWLATTLRSIGDAVITTDANAQVTYLNPAAETLTGWPLGEASGRAVSEILALRDAVSRQPLANPAEAAMRRGSVQSVSPDAELVGRDGPAIPIDDSAAPIVDQSGGVLGSVVVLRDSSERRAAEARIRQLNAELERRVLERTALLEAANRELESFSYSVAHDLRAPLRGIDGFSRALLENKAEQLDAEGRRDLVRVRAAAQRMAGLIDDLLTLAGLARRELRVRDLDLSALAREVGAELAAAQPQRQVSLAIADGLSARGDPGLLRVVLQNLLGNAWKFTAKVAHPRIELFARDTAAGREFVVRDNGAGFDPAYADKLFGAFQRLHLPEEFEGNGIGLATVQRIIHRHGGEVGAHGAVGRGAEVWFTLP